MISKKIFSTVIIVLVFATCSVICWYPYSTPFPTPSMNFKAYDWRKPYYQNFDIQPENYHYQALNGNQLINQRFTPCNCVKLKNCMPLMEIVRKSYSGYIADYINAQTQVISCNIYDGEMAVCCPKKAMEQYDDSRERRSFERIHKVNSQDKWVWDAEENTSAENDESKTSESDDRFYVPKPQTNNFMSFPIQGFYPYSNGNNKKKNQSPFIAYHEDPQTRKNCPPSFSSEFRLPSNHTFYTELENDAVAPTTNIPIVEPPTTVPTTAAPVVTTASTVTGKERLINAADCGNSLGSRIVGGEDAGVGRFPWMARLAYRNKTSGVLTYRCSGSMIADRYLITAAHCVANLLDILEVALARLGDVDLSVQNECNEEGTECMIEQDFEIEKIIVHPNYNNPRYSNDIALIRLKESTAAAPSIGTICLPLGKYAAASNNLVSGTNGIIAGWGARTRTSAVQSTSLQWIRLPYVNNADCAVFYANYTANFRTRIMISTSQICVQGRENADACQGDSGGPLMSEGDLGNDRYILYGLVSFGPRTCGLSNFPGVYTRVSSYMEFILRNIDF